MRARIPITLSLVTVLSPARTIRYFLPRRRPRRSKRGPRAHPPRARSRNSAGWSRRSRLRAAVRGRLVRPDHPLPRGGRPAEHTRVRRDGLPLSATSRSSRTGRGRPAPARAAAVRAGEEREAAVRGRGVHRALHGRPAARPRRRCWVSRSRRCRSSACGGSHIYVGRENPSGIFAPWNPKVSCATPEPSDVGRHHHGG